LQTRPFPWSLIAVSEIFIGCAGVQKANPFFWWGVVICSSSRRAVTVIIGRAALAVAMGVPPADGPENRHQGFIPLKPTREKSLGLSRVWADGHRPVPCNCLFFFA